MCAAPLHPHDMTKVAITLFSAIGTSYIFQDVKDSCKGLLERPFMKFLILWAFCYGVLGQDHFKALWGAIMMLIFYTVVLSMKEKYPETMIGTSPEPKPKTTLEPAVITAPRL
jgi:hypothetical protein